LSWKQQIQKHNALAALSWQMAEAVERASGSIVAVDARPRVRTSGVIWRAGVIISTNHTIRRDEEITIALHDAREVRATLVGRDAGTDLAVLRVEGDGAGAVNMPAQFSDVSTLKVGNPRARHRAHRCGARREGEFRHRQRPWRQVAHVAWRRDRPPHSTDVSIFIGFSGGALLDTEGRVVGINTTGLARGQRANDSRFHG
jgi:S1-C subfamily serine protease